MFCKLFILSRKATFWLEKSFSDFLYLTNRLIPLCVVHLFFIHKQLYSSDPSLVGAYATITAEIHLTSSVLLQIASSLKPFMEVYEDDQGIAYTDSAPKSRNQSGSGSRQGSLSNQGGWRVFKTGNKWRILFSVAVVWSSIIVFKRTETMM